MIKTPLFATLFACSASAAAQGMAMKDEAGMRWACGGAGVEERAALAALRPQANVELWFVSGKRGGYLADVQLSFGPLKVLAEGPSCLIFAPAGKYRVEASYGGVTRSAELAAGAAPGKAARSVLVFPAEAWDGIRADEEEKRQARTP